jgi:hypothetical protein
VTRFEGLLIFDLEGREYSYIEEINEGILRQFRGFQLRGKVLDVGCGREFLL